jgi:hypothetical protein
LHLGEDKENKHTVINKLNVCDDAEQCMEMGLSIISCGKKLNQERNT